MDTVVLLLVGLALGAGAAVGAIVLIRRKAGAEGTISTPQIQVIAERVRTVGRLIGLEVSAKEIATTTKGWSWMPPLLLSQARLAMIFHFEKQYSVDLARLTREDVEELPDGTYRLRLPHVEGVLRLTDVSPYDIQDGRVLGLLDVIQMNAPTQRQLMRQAQEQAAEIFHRNDERYLSEAKASVERQLSTLLGLFDVEVEFVWPEQHAGEHERLEVAEAV